VQGTPNEGMGVCGQGDGRAAYAVALIAPVG